jgi:divinyl protochlorophyllide a 8-vinyl-reductase
MTEIEALGRIGPNAIIRTVEALREGLGSARTAALLRDAGLAGYERELPHEMVAENEVTALFGAIYRELGNYAARDIARSSGERTADYLLANRIPKAAQTAMKVLPASLASRGLLAAIRGKTWTFAGSSTVVMTDGRPALVSFAGCPLCRGATSATSVCEYYAATFERLYRVLVHPAASASEISCSAAGSPACTIEIRY